MRSPPGIFVVSRAGFWRNISAVGVEVRLAMSQRVSFSAAIRIVMADSSRGTATPAVMSERISVDVTEFAQTERARRASTSSSRPRRAFMLQLVADAETWIAWAGVTPSILQVVENGTATAWAWMPCSSHS